MTIVDSLPTVSSLTTTNATGLLLSLNGISFNLGVFGGFINCLYRGNAGLLAAMTATSRGASSYTARTLRMLEAVSVPLSRGGLGCPSSGSFRGTFTLRITQTITLRP